MHATGVHMVVAQKHIESRRGCTWYNIYLYIREEEYLKKNGKEK